MQSTSCTTSAERQGVLSGDDAESNGRKTRILQTVAQGKPRQGESGSRALLGAQGGKDGS